MNRQGLSRKHLYEGLKGSLKVRLRSLLLLLWLGSSAAALAGQFCCCYGWAVLLLLRWLGSSAAALAGQFCCCCVGKSELGGPRPALLLSARSRAVAALLQLRSPPKCSSTVCVSGWPVTAPLVPARSQRFGLEYVDCVFCHSVDAGQLAEIPKL